MKTLERLMARIEALPSRGPRRITIARLAGEAGITRVYLSGIINGSRNPTVDVVDRINDAIDRLGVAEAS